MNLTGFVRLLAVGAFVSMLPPGIEAQSQLQNPRQQGPVPRSPEVQRSTNDFRIQPSQPQAASRFDANTERITKPSRKITPPDDAKNEKKRSTGSFGTMLVALSLIVLLILVVAKLWSKHGPLVNTGLPPEAFQVLGKRQLDQRQTVYLARLGSRILVLGSSPDGLQTLCEITDPIEVDFLAGVCRRDERQTTVAQTFRTLFNKQVSTSGIGNRGEDLPVASPPADALLTGQLGRRETNAPKTRLEKVRG